MTKANAIRQLAALCVVAVSGTPGCRATPQAGGNGASAAAAVSGQPAASGQDHTEAISGGRGGTAHASGQSAAAGTDPTDPTGDDAGAGAALPEEPTTPDGPNAQAFDPLRGALRVDYASYLSKHDIVYNQPNNDPVRGLTVGNGRMGAMVWSANGLTLQVSGVDTSQQTAFSAGLANLTTTPTLDSGSQTFQQRLALHDGVLSTQNDADRTLTSSTSSNGSKSRSGSTHRHASPALETRTANTWRTRRVCSALPSEFQREGRTCAIPPHCAVFARTLRFNSDRRRAPRQRRSGLRRIRRTFLS